MIVIDDTLGFDESSRIYPDYCPSLQSERSGLKILTDNSTLIKEGIIYPSTDITKDNNCEETDFSDSPYRIRKLTPKECWRLMGFSDKDFDKAKDALNEKNYKGKDRSSSQLYKQAGNSIVTDVLFYIFEELYKAMPYLFDNLKVSSYFSGIGAFEVALNKLFATINTKEGEAVDDNQIKEDKKTE